MGLKDCNGKPAAASKMQFAFCEPLNAQTQKTSFNKTSYIYLKILTMEVFIAIIAIILFAIILKIITDKFAALEYHLRDLTRAIENLKKSVDEQPREKIAGRPNPEEIPEIRPEPGDSQLATQIKKEPEIPSPPIEAAKVPEPENVVFQTNFDAPIPVADKQIQEEAVAAPAPKPYAPYVPERSWWEKFKEQNPDLEKFIGENLINKIGVLILVLGISYFVKFAIDKNWINEPARVGIGILSGALVMFFAHRLRKQYAAFSSVLVAGAVSIFYFTIGIAFHDYHLFSQTVAFVIMVVITAFSCFISLSYNRLELAVLSLIGGFAVPFMVSTGQGNYAVLFTYIAILDIGILALAYHKKWNLINILSYIFTVLLYGVWLVDDLGTKAPHHAGALLFAFVFYLIFVLISIINNIRTKGAFSAVELSILASNTFLFYAAGMGILSAFHPELKGLFTSVVALLNLVYAWILFKKFGMDKTAVYLLIGLTLTFATLAIPIQFHGHYITLFWAAEAVVLMWLGQKSGRISYRFASVAVQMLAAISLFMDWYNVYNGQELTLIANKAFVTGVTVVASLLAIHMLLKDDTENREQFGFSFIPQDYRNFVGVSAVILLYFVGIIECYYQADKSIEMHASALAVPLLYHILYSLVAVIFLQKLRSRTGNTIAAVLSAMGIVVFAFGVLGNAFAEHRHIIETNGGRHYALLLHYAAFAAVCYFAVLLYRFRNDKTFPLFGHGFFSWAFAFFIVYIASAELLLHSQVVSNTPVTHVGRADQDFTRMVQASEKISGVNSQVIKTGFPILWGLLAFAFLIFGIRKPSKPMRIIALALLGITILKLFLFDIRNASETGKIIAFILLGVLILIISFVYQKLKVLVLDDKPKTTDETQ